MDRIFKDILCLKARTCLLTLPGYGSFPKVQISYRTIANDQTSDLMVKFPFNASGAVHFTGHTPAKRMLSSDFID